MADQKTIFSDNLDNRIVIDRIEIINKKSLRKEKSPIFLDEM
jgi:hypothetical protein